MSDLITIEYSLTVENRNEAGGDEPRLEFYFFTGLGGQLQVTTVDSGILATNFPNSSSTNQNTLNGLKVHAPLAPTPENRFLGFAVRAYEVDRSNTAEATAGPMEDLQNSLVTQIGPTVAGNRAPTVNEIWLAVNGGGGVPHDDRTGVSARMFRDLGVEVVRDGIRRSYVPNGSQPNDAFRFGAEDAVWMMNFDVFHQSFQ